MIKELSTGAIGGVFKHVQNSSFKIYIHYFLHLFLKLCLCICGTFDAYDSVHVI